MRTIKSVRVVSLMALLAGLSLSAAGLRAGEIHEAAAAGNLNKVRTLVEADPRSVESKDDNGCTPLTRACSRNRPAVANFLIDKGADVNARDKWRQTPLITTCSTVLGQDFNLVERLIAKGADVKAQGTRGESALEGAVARGNVKVAQLLIDHGADLNAYDKTSGTILHHAIRVNQPEMARLLVESGAKLDQRNPFGHTELHMAAINGYAALARLLIEHRVDVNAVDGNSRAALYYAAKHGYRSVADVLIAAGAKESAIVETNYGKASQLASPLKEGEAYLWYLGGFAGDSYAVKTKGHLLLFDPPGIDDAPEAGLANGHVNPGELAAQKITVFITKPEWERYELGVFELAQRIPTVEFVIAFKPEARLASPGSVPSYRLAMPHQSLSMGDVKVQTIPATLGGVAYLVDVDGLKILHAGYHACNETTQANKYRKEIDVLKPLGPIDVAILPVAGHLIKSFTYDSYLYLLDQLLPRAVYLMHGSYEYDAYLKCTDFLRARHIPVEYPEGVSGGDRFHFRRERSQEPPLPTGEPAAGAAPWVTPLVERPGVLHSEVLGEDRQYVICLPYGYDMSQERYPVLFLLDGPRHMNYVAGMVEYLSRYAEAIPPVIVVDIAQQHRSRDMTPTPSADRPDDTGGADRFLAFLSKELVPHIQSRYRTKAPLVLWGYSLSGLFAIHVLLTQPELFDGYITASPSLWWDDSLLLRRARAFFKSHDELNRKLFFAVGARERQAVQDYFNEMDRILKASTPKGFAVTLRRFDGEDHGTICIPTTYQGLKAMFAPSKTP